MSHRQLPRFAVAHTFCKKAELATEFAEKIADITQRQDSIARELTTRAPDKLRVWIMSVEGLHFQTFFTHGLCDNCWFHYTKHGYATRAAACADIRALQKAWKYQIKVKIVRSTKGAMCLRFIPANS